MSKDLPIVPINKMELIENYFSHNNGCIWNALTLIEHSKKFPVFDLPVAGIDLSRRAWKIESIDDFIYHMNRVNKTNLDYPVILNDEGVIVDGLHRVAKAVLQGKTIIKAIRLNDMPDYDSKIEDDE